MIRIVLALALATAMPNVATGPALGSGYPPGVERSRDWLADRTSPGSFRCAHRLWDNESHWRVHAGERSGAYGIPQAYPGRRMSTAERPERGRAWDDWVDDALVQVAWGSRYVRARYGSPSRSGFCAALDHQDRHGWY